MFKPNQNETVQIILEAILKLEIPVFYTDLSADFSQRINDFPFNDLNHYTICILVFKFHVAAVV